MAPAGSLRALVANSVDYAGLFPPASLPLPETLGRYRRYLGSPESWILNRQVLPKAKLGDVLPEDGWRVSLLVDDEPGALQPFVETLESKAPRRLSLPTYCEAPLEAIDGAFAKFRTGGLTPEAIPSPSEVAGLICGAAARNLPFKATAGLHHAIRAPRPLTYEPQSPRAVMHGFLNVLSAAVFAFAGLPREGVLRILEETDPGAFEFREDELRLHGRAVSTAQIKAARLGFIHSFGSCSFEEPVNELRQLGLIE
jgi:hypothetical protein